MKCNTWISTTIGEQLVLQRGYDISKAEQVEGEVPVISSSGIKSFHNQSKVKGPGVLLGRKGTIGTVYYTESDYWPHSTTLYVKDFRNNNPRFVYYFFQSIKEQLKNMDVGTSNPTLNRNHVHPLNVMWPCVEIQNTIETVLSAFDAKIELNNKITSNLQQQAQAIFKSWFVENVDSSEWKCGTFSDIIEKTISGDWGKDKPSGNYTEMVYCIRGADIPEIRLGNKGKIPTRYILPKNYASKQLMNGDIVVEISGGSPTQSTGRVAAISNALLNRYEKGMVCTNFCKAMKPIPGYSMYVYHYWKYLYDLGVFFSYENGTTGIKNLDINGFLEMEPIRIAPPELVRKFDAICQSIFSKIYVNGLESERLSLLRDTLLPKLMNGEIEIDGI